MLRMECVRRHPGQSEVLVESQTAARRVPSVRRSRRQNVAGILELLANVSRDRSTRVPTVASVGQLRVQVSVEAGVRCGVLRLLQRLLFERKLPSLTYSATSAHWNVSMEGQRIGDVASAERESVTEVCGHRQRGPMVSFELLGFRFFPLFFVSGPCARLSWPSRQLLSAR